MSTWPIDWWSVEVTNLSYLGDLANLVLRSTGFALAAGAAELVLRKRPPATRILLWRLVVLTLLLLPLATVVLPAFEIQVLPSPVHRTFQWRIPDPPVLVAPVWSLEAHRSQAMLQRGPSLGTVLFVGYSAIGALLLVRLLYGQWRVQRLIATSRTIELNEAAVVGLRRVGVRESDHLRLPVTAGLFRPYVVLPADWKLWPEDKLSAVLAHEASHAGRYDSGFALLISLTTCAFWFHPVAWFAQWRLAELGEEASDTDAIATTGIDRNRYLEVLLELIQTLRASRPPRWSGSLSMARSSRITRRARRILIATPLRHVSPFVRPAITALAAIAFLITASAQLTSKPVLPKSFVKPASDTFTPSQVAEFENQVKLDPEDAKARGNLLFYYSDGEDGTNWRRHYFWLLEHHPESKLLVRYGPVPFAQLLTDPYYDHARELWQKAITSYPNDPRVLYQAGIFFRLRDSAQCELLVRRAYELAPGEPEFLQALSSLYAEAADSSLQYATTSERLYWTGVDMPPAQAREWTARLQSSQDANLIGFAGHYLTTDFRGAAVRRPSNVREFGFALVRKAEQLDPTFAKRWLQHLASEKERASKARFGARLALFAQPILTVPADQQRLRLLQAPEPEYPFVAKLIHFRGSVRVKIKIDASGRVERADPVDGFLPVRSAAAEAVRKWRYAPTVRDGSRASVISEGVVSFPPRTALPSDQ